MKKKILLYTTSVFLILFLTIANLFLIRLIQLSPKLPSIDHKESVFTHSALDKKQPGVLVIHGKPGDKPDIELLEGTLYKQVILKSKKEKIRVPAGQYNISLNGGKKLWIIVDRNRKTIVSL